jgi:hypothetical protein
VPFVRIVRDKRGAETTYIMHTYRSPQGTGDTRLLYMFRSPAHVTVGRRALDDEARAGLEHTHPDLSFDWQSLLRDAGVEKAPAGRPARDQRAAVGKAPPSPPGREEDDSMLAAVLGASEASRLRSRHRELAERVGRRAPSPEERDRLMERLQRLNPDGWTDESAIRAGVSTVEREWDAIRAALPARRRGRRGGRRREPSPDTHAGPPSGIIREDGDADAGEKNTEVALSDRDAGGSGDDDRVGGAGAGNGLPGDD